MASVIVAGHATPEGGGRLRARGERVRPTGSRNARAGDGTVTLSVHRRHATLPQHSFIHLSILTSSSNSWVPEGKTTKGGGVTCQGNGQWDPLPHSTCCPSRSPDPAQREWRPSKEGRHLWCTLVHSGFLTVPPPPPHHRHHHHPGPPTGPGPTRPDPTRPPCLLAVSRPGLPRSLAPLV